MIDKKWIGHELPAPDAESQTMTSPAPGLGSPNSPAPEKADECVQGSGYRLRRGC